MRKPLPIGISDFKEVIENGYAYVDKTLFIQELVEKGSEAMIISRPSLFGKTLNLSMLRYFFEKGGENPSHLFLSLEIWKNEECRRLAGKFPVVYLSFKNVRGTSLENLLGSFCICLAREFLRHRYLLDGETLNSEEKEKFRKILYRKADSILLARSLRLLTRWLSAYHNERVVVLIDAYDTPISAADEGGFYECLAPLMQQWLALALKGNEHLQFGVLMGILPLVQENNMFTGFNNARMFTVLDENFKDKFGFSELEVKSLLAERNLSQKFEEIKKWYNGYQVGSYSDIYNPWSTLNYISGNDIVDGYWVKTSDHNLISDLLAKGSDDLKMDLEELLKGNTIETFIPSGISLSDFQKSNRPVWALLLFTGYLSIDSTPSLNERCSLRIPNREVREVFKSIVRGWFENTAHAGDNRYLLNSLVAGDVKTFSLAFQQFLTDAETVFDITHDESEKVYHAFVLWLLLKMSERYDIQSNRKSGHVMLIPKNPNDLGIVMEFHKMGRLDPMNLEIAADLALRQIEDKGYGQELENLGVGRILYMGLAFKGNELLVRTQEKTKA
jgi:hypothetical protein